MYMYSNGFYGTINSTIINVIDTNTDNPIYITQNLVKEKLSLIFNKEYAGILSGMLIGETSDISNETKLNFKDSGITHLLAVSGANVMVVIAVSTFLFSKLVGKRYDYIFSIIFIIFFACISGLSPSVLRASIMAITNILLNILLKKPRPLDVLSFSVLIILIYNPISINNIGLILSVFGTLGIILYSTDLSDFLSKYVRIKIIANTLGVTISAQIMLLPIMAYYFNNISVVSLFTNLLVVPVAEYMTIIALGIFFIAILSLRLARVLSYIPQIIIKYILQVSKFCAGFDFLNFTVPTPRLWMIIFLYIILFIELYFLKAKNLPFVLQMAESYEVKKIKYIRKILYGVITFVFVIAMIITLLPNGYVEFTAIDVGQGDSFLIVSNHNKTILIDGGGSEMSDYDVGENVLLPYMLDRWVTHIDIIFVSHAHADHIEGLYTLIDNISIGKIFVSASLENNEYMNTLKSKCTNNKVPIYYVCEGDIITIDNLKFEVMYPNKNWEELDFIDGNENNLSMLLKADLNGTKVLFTGDLESKVEEYLVDKYGKKLESNILKISHHGSKTSSTEEFIKVVNPDVSIISVAENNSYGHPNFNVVERLKKYSKVMMTKDKGEIRIKLPIEGKLGV